MQTHCPRLSRRTLMMPMKANCITAVSRIPIVLELDSQRGGGGVGEVAELLKLAGRVVLHATDGSIKPQGNATQAALLRSPPLPRSLPPSLTWWGRCGRRGACARPRGRRATGRWVSSRSRRSWARPSACRTRRCSSRWCWWRGTRWCWRSGVSWGWAESGREWTEKLHKMWKKQKFESRFNAWPPTGSGAR